MSSLISFIIPHKGRVGLLKQTLQSIFRQDFDGSKIEIIIVTQEPRLDLGGLKNPGSDLKVIYCSPTETIASLKNKGAELVSGEYLAFIDADIELASNWLNAMFEEKNAKENRVAISASAKVHSSASVIEMIWTKIANRQVDQSVGSVHGCNLFLSKKSFETISGFPGELKTCEDIFLTNKLSQIGEVYITSKTYFIHLGGDKNYLDLFKKEIWRSQSNYKSLKQREIPLREWPSILLPFWQLIFFFSFLFSLLSDHLSLAGINLLVLFAPVFFYSVRLYIATRSLSLSLAGRGQGEEKNISFLDIFWFYTVYCSGRTIGSIKGLFC